MHPPSSLLEPRSWTHTWAGRGGEGTKYSAQVWASGRHWTLDSRGLGTASTSASPHIGRTSVSFLLPGAVLVSLSPVSRRPNIDSGQLCLTILMGIRCTGVNNKRSGKGECRPLEKSRAETNPGYHILGNSKVRCVSVCPRGTGAPKNRVKQDTGLNSFL